MKRIFTTVLAALLACAVLGACNTPSTPPTPPVPPAPTEVSNIQLTQNILTFDPVEGASGYLVEFKKNDAVSHQRTLTMGYVDLSGLGLRGTYDVWVYVLNGGEKSDGVSTQLSFLTTFDTIVLEAEMGLRNYSSYRNNNLASGGAYAGGIDNAGNGVAFDVFSYVAGEFDFECYYTTDMNPAINQVWVNGEVQTHFDFTEKTGWGAAGKYTPAKATAKITLEEGWNTISVIKDGNESNNWGSYAELDYFVIRGNGETYNPDDVEGDASIAPAYRLEAEHAAHIVRQTDGVQLTWVATANPPTAVSNASGGFMMANLDALGQGLEWCFHAPRTGRYELSISFAHDNGANTGATQHEVCFYHTSTRLVDRALNRQLLDGYNKQLLPLGVGQGWSSFLVNTETLTLELTEGDNFIYAVKESECWFQIDYIELKYVGEGA